MHLDPEYVLDKMAWYEIETLIGNRYMVSKENWEQARLISYFLCQVNSTKKIDYDTFLQFEWNKHKEEEVEVDMDEFMKEIQAMERKMNTK